MREGSLLKKLERQAKPVNPVQAVIDIAFEKDLESGRWVNEATPTLSQVIAKEQENVIEISGPEPMTKKRLRSKRKMSNIKKIIEMISAGLIVFE